MQDFASLDLNSLKKMASQFQKKEEERSKREKAEVKEEKIKEPAEDLKELPEPLDEEEEYIEFPVLKKHKTYNINVLKPNKKPLPQRVTVLKSKLTGIEISLKDSEVFEQSSIRNEMQPFVLKNSHAIFTGLEDADEVVFNIDLMGNSHMKIKAKGQSESLELGCIIRYELRRKDANSLIVASRDIDADVEVLGGPCKIEFYLPEVSEKAEKAILRRLEVDDELSRLNEEAGRSINWLA